MTKKYNYVSSFLCVKVSEREWPSDEVCWIVSVVELDARMLASLSRLLRVRDLNSSVVLLRVL